MYQKFTDFDQIADALNEYIVKQLLPNAILLFVRKIKTIYHLTGYREQIFIVKQIMFTDHDLQKQRGNFANFVEIFFRTAAIKLIGGKWENGDICFVGINL